MRIENKELKISISKKSYNFLLKVAELNKILKHFPNENINHIETLVFKHGVTYQEFLSKRGKKHLNIVK